MKGRLKRKTVKRIAAFGLASLMLMDTVSAFAENEKAVHEAEENLKAELAARSGDYPSGAFAFYESGAKLKEGDEDREVWLVRLGDVQQAASVDVKCMDVTAKYREDYTLSLYEDGKTTSAETEGDTKTAAEAAMEEKQNPPSLEIAVSPQAADAAVTAEDPEKSTLKSAYEIQTGKTAADTNWREELKEQAGKAASIAAENELINSFEGFGLTVSFAPGEYKKTLRIHVEDDDLPEGDESAALLLGNATVGMIGEQGQFRIDIADNEETERIVFAMEETELIVPEESETAEVTVLRESGTGYYANAVCQTVSGTAKSGEAYEAANGVSVSFAAGETKQTLRIPILDQAKTGTYFTVKLDTDAVHVKEGHESIRVWIGEKAENAEITGTTEKREKKAFRIIKGEERSGNVTYDTQEISCSLDAYTHSKSNLNRSSEKSADYRSSMKQAAKATFWTTLYGYSKNCATKYYNKNGTLYVNGSEKVYHSVPDKKKYETTYHSDTVDLSYSQSESGSVKVKANTDGFCRTAGYKLTKMKLYYPRYTLKLENAAQNMTGKNYTSLSKSTTFSVPALEGNASWSQKTVKKDQSVSILPGSLTNGVGVKEYELWIGDRQIKTVYSDSIYYSDLNGLRNSWEWDLKNNNYTVTVKPIYETKKASVSFASQDASAIAFSGNKKQDGFKVDDTLSCTRIDKVTFTAVCPSGQEIKVSSVKREKKVGLLTRLFSRSSSSNRTTIETLRPKNAAEELQFTHTIEVDNANECLTVYYEEPTISLHYDETELTAANKDAGAVAISDYAKPDEIIGTSTYRDAFRLNGKLDMLNTTYLAQVMMGEGFDHFTVPVNGREIPFSTRTLWTMRDPDNAGKYKTVVGNSLVFAPYYADTDISYYFKAIQDDETQVGLDGTVYISEIPLFSGAAKKRETPAVGVNVNIGGYQTTTGSDGSYHIGANFNKGEYVGAYLSYDTLTMTGNVALSKNSRKDFTISVEDADKLRVTDSYIRHFVKTGERDMKNQPVQIEKEAAGVTLEDAEYRLVVKAEGSAGTVPARAEFTFYNKKGEKKTDFTQSVSFNNEGTAELLLNPMSVGGGDGKSLAVGDAVTVKLYDTKGNGYFEHHTGIVIAEKMEGMYAFNYKGVQKEDDNAFVKALGNISVGYDFVLDILASDAGTYRDAEGNMHQLMCIGFGEGFGSAEAVYQKEQETIRQLDQANTVGIRPTKKDSLSFAGSGSWGLDIQVGAIMDSVLEEEDEEKKGQYKFSDYILIGNVTASYKKEWTVPVGPVNLVFTLAFSSGDLADGDAIGIKWHFYNPSEKDFYIKQNNTFDLLGSDEIESKGDLEIYAHILGSVEANLLDLIGVSGNLQVEFENHFAHQTDEGWTNSGAIILTPTVKLKLLFASIPLWTQAWRWDYNNEDAARADFADALGASLNGDLLYASTEGKEMADYSYAVNRKGWKAGGAEKAITDSLAEKVLQEGFYDSSKVALQQLSNGKYLAVFLDIVEGRKEEDKIGAFYSIYDGTKWSTPELLDEDHTADEMPVICEAGSKGYLVAWSDANGLHNAEADVSENLNQYDLCGRFYDETTGTFGGVMQITKTTELDKAADTNPHIAYDRADDGTEYMKIYYTKSEYSVSDKTEGEAVGDLLNPDQFIAVRNYDFTNNTWSEEYSDSLKDKITGAGNNYEEYKASWYGQEFLDLAPTLSVTEELDEEGFWKEGTQAQIAEKDHSASSVKDGDAIAYNHLALFAYALDKGGMAQETQDENLYLQIYNFVDEEYHHPILISGKDAQISDIQFVRSAVPGTDEEATFLYWLEDGAVKRINISNLVQNSLRKGTLSGGEKNQEYYYVDKTRPQETTGDETEKETDFGYEPEEIIAASETADASEEETEAQSGITSFGVKQNGGCNYIVWSKATQRGEGEEKKMESQLYAVREEIETGDTSLAVQLTDKEDQYIKAFDFAVTEEGNLFALAGRQTLDEKGEPAPETSQLAAFDITPSQKTEIVCVEEGDACTDEEGKTAVSLSADIKNYGLKSEEIVIEVTDSKGNKVYSSEDNCETWQAVETTNEDGSVTLTETPTEAPEEEGATGICLRGGDAHSFTAQLPLADDASYSGKITIKQKNGGAVLAEQNLEGTAKAVLSASDLETEITDRDHVRISAKLTNESAVESGAYHVTFGYKKEDGTKTVLKTMEMPSLASLESTDVQYDAEVGFDTFVKKTEEDGAQTDSMEFYIDADTKDYVPVYGTVSLNASAEEMALMNSLKGHCEVKCASVQKDADYKTMDTLKAGDTAELALLVDGKIAQNTEEYANGLKIVWEEKTDAVAKVTRDGFIQALKEGTTTVKGYALPADTKYVFYEGGTSDTVDNYQVMPSAAILPVEAVITVGKGGTPADPPEKPAALKVGTSFLDPKSNLSFTVSSASAGKMEVICTKYSGKAAKAEVPSVVVKNGVTYQVTGIGANAFLKNKKLKSVIIGKNVKTIGKKAFFGCKNLKKITVKTKQLKKVGNKAISGIHKSAVIKVPSKKKKAYKKLFKSKTGYKKTMKIK